MDFHFPLPRFAIGVKVLAFVGWIVTIVGVGGELYTQSYVSDADTNIQAFNTAALAEEQRRTGAAIEVAGFANLQAELEREHTAKLEIEGTQLKTKAESERLARIALEASVGWRRLTEQQQNEIGFDISLRFRNAGISVWYLHGDIEGARFAADIAEALRKAKLHVWPPIEGGVILRSAGNINDPITRDPTGLSVEPTTTNGISGFLADAIVEELTSRGFDASRKKATRAPDFTSPPEVVINVLARPEGPQGEFKLEAERGARTSNAKRNRLAWTPILAPLPRSPRLPPRSAVHMIERLPAGASHASRVWS